MPFGFGERGASALACLLVCHGMASSVRADDLGVELMSEPTEFTNVIDAFDEGQGLDVNLRLGFSRSRAVGQVQREVTAEHEASGRGALSNVGRHEAIRNQLMLGVDVGLFRDLMLFGRLPLILSDDRRLHLPDGRSADEVDADLHAPLPTGHDGARQPGDDRLFEVPFRSPTRSGIDWLGLGLAWGITNQYRSPNLPTWVLLVEGRFGVGSLLTPCVERGESRAGLDAGLECAGEGSASAVGRGTHVLRLESRVSKRFRFLEPYFGAALQLEWAGKARSRFSPTDDLAGAPHAHPPNAAELTAGAMLVPWEDRERFQRFALDIRGQATHFSAGRDYSPLFDALGTSRSAYLTAPQYPRLPAAGEPAPDAVPFTGLTDVTSRTRLGLRGAVVLKAARYVQFSLGAGIGYDTAYFLSGTPACHTAAAGGDPGQVGSCTAGIINPHHRGVIDLPGQRFRLDGLWTLDLFAAGMAQF